MFINVVTLPNSRNMNRRPSRITGRRGNLIEGRFGGSTLEIGVQSYATELRIATCQYLHNHRALPDEDHEEEKSSLLALARELYTLAELDHEKAAVYAALSAVDFSTGNLKEGYHNFTSLLAHAENDPKGLLMAVQLLGGISPKDEVWRRYAETTIDLGKRQYGKDALLDRAVRLEEQLLDGALPDRILEAELALYESDELFGDIDLITDPEFRIRQLASRLLDYPNQARGDQLFDLVMADIHTNENSPARIFGLATFEYLVGHSGMYNTLHQMRFVERDMAYNLECLRLLYNSPDSEENRRYINIFVDETLEDLGTCPEGELDNVLFMLRQAANYGGAEMDDIEQRIALARDRARFKKD